MSAATHEGGWAANPPGPELHRAMTGQELPPDAHERHEQAEKREAVHRLGLQDFGEEFEVYRSGAATTLLCLRCAASRSILGRIRLTALVDEAGAHADTCHGRED